MIVIGWAFDTRLDTDTTYVRQRWTFRTREAAGYFATRLCRDVPGMRFRLVALRNKIGGRRPANMQLPAIGKQLHYPAQQDVNHPQEKPL